jgi:molybdopterin-guanine dinucleotide biosynthesis protein A
MIYSAVILAGGMSSRMGSDKAFLRIGGQTLLARQIEAARAAGAVEVFISGNTATDYSPFRCRVLADRLENTGPLAGIEAALAHASHPHVLVLAVDLPAMQPELLDRLAGHCTPAAGAVPRVNGFWEPLAAFYPRAALPLARQLLNENKLAAHRLADDCHAAGLVTEVDLTAEARQFTNWNLPADWTPAAPPPTDPAP